MFKAARLLSLWRDCLYCLSSLLMENSPHLAFLKYVEQDNQSVVTKVVCVFIRWHGLKVTQQAPEKWLLGFLISVTNSLTPTVNIPRYTCKNNKHTYEHAKSVNTCTSLRLEESRRQKPLMQDKRTSSDLQAKHQTRERVCFIPISVQSRCKTRFQNSLVSKIGLSTSFPGSPSTRPTWRVGKGPGNEVDRSLSARVNNTEEHVLWSKSLFWGYKYLQIKPLVQFRGVKFTSIFS